MEKDRSPSPAEDLRELEKGGLFSLKRVHPKLCRTPAGQDWDLIPRAPLPRIADALSERGWTPLPVREPGAAAFVHENTGGTCRIASLPCDDLAPMIGKTVSVRIDRPKGSRHPTHPDMVYPIPYGFLPGTASGDGEEIDAYLVGYTHSEEFGEGKDVPGAVLGLIRRADDREEKLIVGPPNAFPEAEELWEAVRFTERYFASSLYLPPVRTEKSAGAVLFSIWDGEPAFLLLRQRASGRLSFPKGHVKEGESPLDAALREILEETGISLSPRDFLPDGPTGSSLWRRELCYSTAPGMKKDVALFLAEVPADVPLCLPENEIGEARFMREEDAAALLSPDQVRILSDAARRIRRSPR